MRGYRLVGSMWLGLCLLAFAGCAPQPTAGTPQVQVPPIEPGMARVWFLRQQDPQGGNVYAAAPVISANDVPLGEIREGTAFFHNFPPGRYKFKVQPYGTPTGERDTLQLVPGAQTYLQVQWVPNWQTGSTAGGSSFSVQAMSPEVAQQYLPTLTNLGQR